MEEEIKLQDDNSRYHVGQPFEDTSDYIGTLIQYAVSIMRVYLYQETNLLIEKDISQNRYVPDIATVNYILEKKEKTDRFSDRAEDSENWEAYIEERLILSKDRGQNFFLDHCMQTFAIDQFGRFAMVLSLMASTETEYQEVFRYLNGNLDKPYPTLATAAKLYTCLYTEAGIEYYTITDEEYEALSAVFPSLKSSLSPYYEQLSMDRSLVSAILESDLAVPDFARMVSHLDTEKTLLFREDETAELSSIIGSNRPAGGYELFMGLHPEEEINKVSGDGAIILIQAEKGMGKRSILETAARAASRGVLYFDVSEYISNPEAFEKDMLIRMRILIRNSILTGCVLAIEGVDVFEEQISRMFFTRLKNEIRDRLRVVFVISDDPDYRYYGRDAVMFKVSPLDALQNRDIWKLYSEKMFIMDNREELISAAANTFSFTPGQIVEALKSAAMKGISAGRPISTEALFDACYQQTDHKLQKKGERVQSGFGWDDIKLPPEEEQTLREICYRVKYKNTIMSEWGFDSKVPYGSGTPVVFAGPPGTGKTMAAQVPANELHMVMYRIDLSQLVDKYIGETEKNIKMVFEEAKKSSSILFFDEADALFGKRVEAGNSNDRFANIESSLLLQCVEDYNGISILATNNLAAMDPAFIRRFKYVMYFRSPDEKLRREIWQSVFPAAAPLAADVDFGWLAESFALTGAQIKNIALSAAFLAASQKAEISLLHILKGLRTEWIKEGRRLNEGDLGEYGYLYKMV